MASFINVFTKYLSKTWRKRCHILTQNSNIQFNMYVSLHHHVFLYLTFIYLSIPSSLWVQRTANTWWILLHNDMKSWHWTIKKQRHYERLRCNTSLVIPEGYGKVRQGPRRWVPRCTFRNIYWKLIVPSYSLT